MVIKRLLAISLLFLTTISEGQDFRTSFAGKDLEIFKFNRNVRWSLDLYENDSLLIHSEPIYDYIRYCDGFDYAAVSIPIKSVDGSGRERYNDPIWVCVDKELNSVFYFPLNTLDVQIDTTLHAFLYTDMLSFNHDWYWRGAISFDGVILFKPPCSKIIRIGDSYLAIGAIGEKTSDPIVENRRIRIINHNYEEIFNDVFKRYTPEATIPPLFGSAPEFLLSEEFQKSPQFLDFVNGIHRLYDLNLSSAALLFKSASKGPDKRIRSMARANLKLLSKLSKSLKCVSK